jgi:hypothetical protein
MNPRQRLDWMGAVLAGALIFVCCVRASGASLLPAMHLVFGVALLVGTPLWLHRALATGSCRRDVCVLHALSRRFARRVYLAMYAMVGVDDLLGWMSAAGPVPAAAACFNSRTDLACGCVAIVIIRAMLQRQLVTPPVLARAGGGTGAAAVSERYREVGSPSAAGLLADAPSKMTCSSTARYSR